MTLTQIDNAIEMDTAYRTQSVHAEVLPWTMEPLRIIVDWFICHWISLQIDHYNVSTDFGADSSAVFLLERGQADKETDATERSTPHRRLYSRRG